MKKIIFSALLILTVLFSLAGCSQKITLTEKSYSLDKELSSIILTDINMDIVFEQGDSDSLSMTYYTSEGKYYYSISYTESSATLRVERKDVPAFLNFSYTFQSGCKTVVTLPADYDGNLTITTVNGDIKLDAVSASKVTSKTTNGDTVISSVNIEGEGSFKTSNGTYSVSSSSIDDFSIDSTNGNITINDSTFLEDFKVELANGTIDIKNIVSGGSINITNSNGSISLKDSDFAVLCNIENTTGSITISLKGKQRDYSVTASAVVGTTNYNNPDGGDKDVYASTSVGDIKVTFLG
ncbi:MAG: DUF4097 family beta strand repeat protein [Bacillales bacterium]|nr:DUF4097 family beta strand repeat protein [Bacillales bacterium]